MFKSMVFGVVFLFLASVASAQPLRDGLGPHARMDIEGRQSRLGLGPRELPNIVDKNQNPVYNKLELPGKGKQFPPFNSNKNKYGGPLNNGMRGWGGSPFKDFGPSHPWGQWQESPIRERHRHGGPQHKLVCPYCGKVIV